MTVIMSVKRWRQTLGIHYSAMQIRRDRRREEQHASTAQMQVEERSVGYQLSGSACAPLHDVTQWALGIVQIVHSHHYSQGQLEEVMRAVHGTLNGVGSVQMELACNYNASSTENGALCEHIGKLVIGFLRLPPGPSFTTNVNLMDLSQGNSSSGNADTSSTPKMKRPLLGKSPLFGLSTPRSLISCAVTSESTRRYHSNQIPVVLAPKSLHQRYIVHLSAGADITQSASSVSAHGVQEKALFVPIIKVQALTKETRETRLLKLDSKSLLKACTSPDRSATIARVISPLIG
ncbi:hypothetical protein FQN60_005601 [Etheostoma spectabile]|uniref:Uncharacterized protein n=1 Tax=Etheostoma spectabile TaxID=54343 RepID=A0A5J5CHR0_9PERO|nr:hypothetical protein FQN60_005601 [Etheostoma spectabile]